MCMNIQELDILNTLMQEGYTNQRILSSQCGHSLGMVNSALKHLAKSGYVDALNQPTIKAKVLGKATAPESAVILAAGFGMRMVPINTLTPKALLQVHGEPLIERIICQLHDVGIRKIWVVVGFMKEHFEYLIDEYGVQLVFNPDYGKKNNLHSLKLVLDQLSNTYIIPCDLWFRENPFRPQEFYSWYMVTDCITAASTVRVNRKRELSSAAPSEPGNRMVGIAYLTAQDSAAFQKRAKALCADSHYDSVFWEEALFGSSTLSIGARMIPDSSAVEINTYEQLRSLDKDSNHLQTDAIHVIMDALQTDSSQITNITVLKKGMTNRSFLFRCNGKQYIMRIPGEGTDQLINRTQEAAVYQAINGMSICDDVKYIDPKNGYKITEFLQGARVCDPFSPDDVAACMKRLRQFHETKLQVAHTFDIFGQIDFYESLWNGNPSCFRDYRTTKAKVFALKPYIDSMEKDWCLTHIDAVPDNFLFTTKSDGTSDLRLIDWEYAGMQDPHVDIAMFCIYAMYDDAHIEQLIDTYFPEGCDTAVRTKIYCYIAACGLLWSNWCEYKRQLGVEFGEYSLRQYRYAKDYCRIAMAHIGQGGLSCTL